MTPQQFIDKWKRIDLSERSACQSHFLDLCDLLGQPKPTDVDPTGDWYTFEKGVSKDTGGQGFADVWRRGFFGWEYKKKKRNLADAYRQLSGYREALANPPLLVVCDLNKFEIHSNFTGTLKEVHAFDLDGLVEPKNFSVLRHVFTDPDKLRPGRTQKQVTEDIARRFGELADGLRGRGVDPHDAGHFLMKLMFCMFAEDIGLLPENLFLQSVEAAKDDPAALTEVLAELFDKMNRGGRFGRERLDRFNGKLFADGGVVPLAKPEIDELIVAARCDWSAVEPSIFGTLFERILNPDKRSQLGAHYTGRTDIETLLRPVLLAPLRREWDAVRADADKLWANAAKVKSAKAKAANRQAFENVVGAFLARLEAVTVLDPACGSGNFLYVALNLLLDLENEVLTYLSQQTGQSRLPGVRPTQLRGIEVNPYARELAQVVIWIGYLQWVKANGFQPPRDPVLDPLDTIENRDAVLDLTDPANPKEPDWPAAEFIVGNPPFLGNKKMRGELGEDYVEALWKLYRDRIPAMSDFVAYWFEKSRTMIAAGGTKRAGLLATTGIKQVGGRRALERIAKAGRIFFAESDRDWTLDGAAVRIVMVGFEGKDGDTPPVLDGETVLQINPDLTSGMNATAARRLIANEACGYMGTTKVGAFDISFPDAVKMLNEPNPDGRPNSDVLRLWVNGSDIVRVPENKWIIDFGVRTEESDALMYAPPLQASKSTRSRVSPGQRPRDLSNTLVDSRRIEACVPIRRQ